MVRKQRKFSRLFGEGRRYYVFLFFTLLALIVIYPLTDPREVGRIVLSLFLTAILLGGAMAVSENRLGLVACLVSGGLMIGGDLVDRFLYPGQLSDWFFIATGAGVVFFLLVTLVLLRHIFTFRGPVSSDLLYGAVSVYLLIGITFAFGFTLVANLQPDSFRGLPASGEDAANFLNLLYFSFVTLTTLGYGDVSPVSRIAGVFATLEALCGQMYLTILVARLVGMHISQNSP